jgi:hypothetical protein
MFEFLFRYCFVFVAIFFIGCSASKPMISTNKADAKLFTQKDMTSPYIKLHKRSIATRLIPNHHVGCKIKRTYDDRKGTTYKIDKTDKKLEALAAKSIYTYEEKNGALSLYLAVNNGRYYAYCYPLTDIKGFNTCVKPPDSRFINTFEKKELIRKINASADLKLINPIKYGYKVKIKVKNVEPVRIGAHVECGVTYDFEILDYNQEIQRYLKAIKKYDATLLTQHDKTGMAPFINKDLKQALLSAKTVPQVKNILKISKYANIRLDKKLVQIKLNQLFFNQKYKYMLTNPSYKELNR